MTGTALLDLLQRLEVSLHQASVRNDRAQLDHLLHQDFHEIGRSGEQYSKVEVMRNLLQQDAHPFVWAQDFALNMISVDVGLLTYKSAHIGAQGNLTNHALRSSIWKFSPDGWQMLFHQGTPTLPFQQD